MGRHQSLQALTPCYPSGDSQGDARYLISNSKDQTIKLWDIRRFSSREGMEASRQAATQQNWDYRWQQVPKKGEWRRQNLTSGE